MKAGQQICWVRYGLLLGAVVSTITEEGNEAIKCQAAKINAC